MPVARKGVEGGGHGAGGLSDLCVDDEPAIGGSRQSGDAFKFLDELFIQLVASSGVNDDQVGGRTRLQPVPNDGDSVLVVRFAVHLDGGVLQELRKLGVGTGSVNVGFDDCDAQTVLFAIPFSKFCGGGGFPLTVQANQQQRGAAWLEGRWRAKNSNQLGVQDVHGVGLDGEAGAWFFLSHACFEPVDDFLGLTYVEIGFLERSAQASRHFSKFFLIEFTFVLEKPERAEDSPRQALKCHGWA